MNLRTRSLSLALVAGLLGPGPLAPLAFAQEDPADSLGDLDFPAPEVQPVHDYTSGPDAEGFSSLEERVSYAIGLNIGIGLSAEFEQMEATLDSAALSEAIGQATSGAETRLSDDQVGSTLDAFQDLMIQRQLAQAEEQSAANRKVADAFFAENAAKEGVVTTESGLQYQLETRGDGEVATEGQAVQLNYRGTLLDGTEFDSSFDFPEPAVFPIGQVIPGFDEALQLLPVGSKGTIWIPADLAYGDTPPRGTAIEPGSALVFELDIVGIEEEQELPDDFLPDAEAVAP